MQTHLHTYVRVSVCAHTLRQSDNTTGRRTEVNLLILFVLFLRITKTFFKVFVHLQQPANKQQTNLRRTDEA